MAIEVRNHKLHHDRNIIYLGSAHNSSDKYDFYFQQIYNQIYIISKYGNEPWDYDIAGIKRIREHEPNMLYTGLQLARSQGLVFL